MSDSGLDNEKNGAFDESRLNRLIGLMKEHDLVELEVRDQEQCIRLKRAEHPGLAAPAPPAYPAAAYAPAAPAAAPAPAAASAPPSSGDEPEGDHIVYIKSPMVGTFYSRPNPKSELYVKVGDHVEAETTVCIIEAMKVFNEIPAEVRGKIVAVLVDNEEPVEFGKPLFKVDTKG